MARRMRLLAMKKRALQKKKHSLTEIDRRMRLLHIKLLAEKNSSKKELSKSIDQITKSDEKELLKVVKKFENKDITNIILLGHHPIISIREKYENYERKPPFKTFKPVGIDLIKKLYNCFAKAKKYYICADVHQYQKMTIKVDNIPITQYVVGTGGTDLDDTNCSSIFYKSSHEKYNNGTVSIQSAEKCDNKVWGYLKVSEMRQGALNFKFVLVKKKEKTKEAHERNRERNRESLTF